MEIDPGTQIGRDGNRYPIGDPRLDQEPDYGDFDLVETPNGQQLWLKTVTANGGLAGGGGGGVPPDGSVTNAKVAAGAAIEESKLALAADAAAGTPSRRSLGSGATQATAGNDARLSDARTPTDGSVTNAKVAAGAAIEESKLALAADAAAGTPSRRSLGSGATQATAGNDARLSNARTPTAHATSHQPGGSDAVNLTPALASGGFYVARGAGATQALTLNRLYYTPFDDLGGAIDRIGIAVTTAGAAGSVLRLGVYNPTATGLPGARLFEAGTVDGTVVQDTLAAMLTVAQTLPTGRGFFACVAQGGTPTVRSISSTPMRLHAISVIGLSPVGYFEDSITGALPANASATVGPSSGVPRPQIRAA